MLKSLVQLFAEKFLQNKREWVADQSTISIQSSSELPVIADGESHPFTMAVHGGCQPQRLWSLVCRYWRVQSHQSRTICEWESFDLGLR